MIGIEQYTVQAGAGVAGQNINTAQPWFPGKPGLLLDAGVTYYFNGFLWLSRAAGVVSHTTSLSFGGTAILTHISYKAWVKTGDTGALAALNGFGTNSAAAQLAKAASISPTEQFIADVDGVVKINAAGTFTPQFNYSAAPGGVPTIRAYFNLTPIGTDDSPQGTWS